MFGLQRFLDHAYICPGYMEGVLLRDKYCGEYTERPAASSTPQLKYPGSGSLSMCGEMGCVMHC